jgi:hypothetical protein
MGRLALGLAEGEIDLDEVTAQLKIVSQFNKALLLKDATYEMLDLNEPTDRAKLSYTS